MVLFVWCHFPDCYIRHWLIQKCLQPVATAAAAAVGCLPGGCCSAASNTCDAVDVRSVARCRRTAPVGLWRQQLSRVHCVTSHQHAICCRVISCCWCCRHRRWDRPGLPHVQHRQVCFHSWHCLDGNWRWKVITVNILQIFIGFSFMTLFIRIIWPVKILILQFQKDPTELYTNTDVN